VPIPARSRHSLKALSANPSSATALPVTRLQKNPYGRSIFSRNSDLPTIHPFFQCTTTPTESRERRVLPIAIRTGYLNIQFQRPSCWGVQYRFPVAVISVCSPIGLPVTPCKPSIARKANHSFSTCTRGKLIRNNRACSMQSRFPFFAITIT